MALSVVMPLDISGESAKYPALFEKMGVDFTARRCTTPEEVVVLARDADAIITEAGLAFIGLGVDPSKPDWGYDIYRGRSELVGGRWWPVTFPGLAIALVALGFSLFGEGLSEILNPRLTEA